MNRKALFAVVAVVIVLGLYSSLEYVVLPLESKSPPIPSVTVKNAFSEVNVTGNFVNYSSDNNLFFNNTTSTAVIYEQGHRDSTLSVSISKGFLFYDPPDKMTVIMVNISIFGSLESNLHPSALIFGLSSNGSAKKYNITTQILGGFNRGNNTSMPYILSLEGYMSATYDIKLTNEPLWSASSGYEQSRYNFSFSTVYQIAIWSFTGIHTFGIWTELGGLSKTPIASVSIITTDTW